MCPPEVLKPQKPLHLPSVKTDDDLSIDQDDRRPTLARKFCHFFSGRLVPKNVLPDELNTLCRKEPFGCHAATSVRGMKEGHLTL